MTAITLGPDTLPSLPTAITGLLAILLIYRIIIDAYRLHFHPLAKFPGPKLYAASYFPYLFQDKIRGTFAKKMLNLHEKYGPIVRVSPNRLAIDGSIAWTEVFGHRGSRPEFRKTVEFYGLEKRVGLFPTDKEDHRRQRRLLSHAFSNAALQEQEEYLKFYVDLLMQRLRENMQEGKIVDMTRWYNFTTFDIIGELAFADPFHSLAKSDYHPWVAMIFDSIKAGSFVQFLMHYPLLRPLVLLLMGRDLIKKRDESIELAKSKTEKRLQLGNDATRKDFMTYILRHNTDGKGMTHDEIIVNSRALIVAGSETTATALSGLTFYLAQNPGVLDRLTKEIRTTFSSEDEINMTCTAQLPYLHACLEETLRIYPPAAETPPRVSPGEFINGQYIPEGTYITVYQWATHHSPRNFTDPDKFVPERWLPTTHPMYDTRYSGDNKAACRPFAYGPRDCIGKNLAYAEMQLVAARLLWNFDFELMPGQDNWASQQAVFVVYEKGPLMLRLKQAARV